MNIQRAINGASRLGGSSRARGVNPRRRGRGGMNVQSRSYHSVNNGNNNNSNGGCSSRCEPPPEQLLPPPPGFVPPPGSQDYALFPRGPDNEDDDFSYSTSSSSSNEESHVNMENYKLEFLTPPLNVDKDEEEEGGEEYGSNFFHNARMAALERLNNENRAMLRLGNVCGHISPSLNEFPSRSPSPVLLHQQRNMSSVAAAAGGVPMSPVEEEVEPQSIEEDEVEPEVEAAEAEGNTNRGPNAPTMEGAGVPPQEKHSYLFYMLVIPTIAVLTFTLGKPTWRLLSSFMY